MTHRARNLQMPAPGLLRPALVMTLILVCGLFETVEANAQVSAADEAQRLFDAGKARLAEGDYAQACPLLEQSYRADPATGALLALALCHERAGRLASAQREYAQAAERSEREQRCDREQAALERAAALEPKLSKLTISAEDVQPGLVVELDGEPLQAAQLDTPLGVDGGEHVIEAHAPGKRPYQLHTRVEQSGDSRQVTIPALRDAVPALAAPRKTPARDRRESSGLPAESWVGLGSLGLGVVGLGVGTVLSIRASGNSSKSNGCADDGSCEYRAAYGNRSKEGAALAFVVGGVLSVSGALIYLVTKPAAEGHEQPVRAGAFVLPGRAGASIAARF